VPQDRAQALRAAFLAKVDVSPVGGADVLATIERIAGASPRSVDHLRKLLAESKGGG
jgi:hypothetical protein